MEPKKYDYILLIFMRSEDQDNFVNEIGKDLALLADSKNVKYYYGDETAIFTFSSKTIYKDLSEYLGIMYDTRNLQYIFMPLDKNNISTGFNEIVNDHLFNDKNTDTGQIKIITPNIDELNKELMEFCDDEDDDDLLVKLRNKTIDPSIDEILDKIGETGIKSLTTKEKTILDNYSKQL